MKRKEMVCLHQKLERQKEIKKIPQRQNPRAPGLLTPGTNRSWKFTSEPNPKDKNRNGSNLKKNSAMVLRTRISLMKTNQKWDGK